jgi:SAM-dependent methyltransferase
MDQSLCLHCNSKHLDLELEVQDMVGDTFHLCRCKDCFLLFLNPLPSEAQLQSAYNQSYYGEGESKFLPWIERVIDFLRSRNAHAFSKRIPPKACVLDFGCGNGQFLTHLAQFGDYELHGLEIAGASAERAKKNSQINLTIGKIKTDTYAANKFDAIILTHVFEHLLNPEEVLDILTATAKDGACIQIEIPNIHSWQYSLFKSNWLHLDPPRRIHFYTPALLKWTLIERGWLLKSEKYFSPQYSPFGFQQSFLNAIGIKRDLLYESMKGNKEYTKGYSKLGLVMQYLFHYATLPLFIFSDLIASIFKKGATVKMVFQKA